MYFAHNSLGFGYQSPCLIMGGGSSVLCCRVTPLFFQASVCPMGVIIILFLSLETKKIILPCIVEIC
jgi:hypothetical protein